MQQRASPLAATFIILVFSAYIVVRLFRQLHFGGGFDSALLGNVLWRLANGFDSQTAMTGGHYLSTHASPILGFFLPVFRFVPELGLITLYIAQAASVALVGWASWLLTSHWQLAMRFRWILLASVLLSPGAWLAAEFQINETTLGLGPLALGLVLAIRGDSVLRVAPWAALAATCRLEMAAAVLFGGFALWLYRRGAHAFWFALLGGGFLVVYLGWLVLNPYETESIAAHFSHLGATPTEIMRTAASQPLRALEPVLDLGLLPSLIFWLLPFGLVGPILHGRWLIVAVPTAGVAIFGVWPAADAFIHHYWYSLLVGGLVASAHALSTNRWFAERAVPLIAVGWCLSWLMMLPLLEHFWPAESLQPDKGNIEIAMEEVNPSYASVVTPLADSSIDRPYLALFPRPFLCSEAGLGPYTAPSTPPEVIVMPRNADGVINSPAETALEPLLASYLSVEVTDRFEMWRIDDFDSAQRSYTPCSVTTFDVH